MITRENTPDCVSISASVDISWGPFYKHGLTLTPAWISNRMPCKVLAEITSLFPNFNDCTIQVWKWISNFIPHFMVDVITYPCCDQCSSMLVKGPLEWGMMSCQEAPFFNRVGISDRHTDAFRHPQTELSTCTCNPLKDVHTFFVLCIFVVYIIDQLLSDSCGAFTHILQGCFTGSGAIIWFPPVPVK